MLATETGFSFTSIHAHLLTLTASGTLVRRVAGKEEHANRYTRKVFIYRLAQPWDEVVVDRDRLIDRKKMAVENRHSNFRVFESLPSEIKEDPEKPTAWNAPIGDFVKYLTHFRDGMTKLSLSGRGRA